MRILIADDDALSRTLLERMLQRAGYEVTVVDNGRSAVEHLCCQDGPRLALLDWVMPELDGPAVCRQVRQKREQPYVHMLLLTAKESKQDVVEGLESGADDYLVKPFDVGELKARLRTGLRILQLEDRLVEAREDMRFKATHDPLTGLFNRGVIVDLLAREVARSHREGSCSLVLLGDVDHFKAINDTRGHVVGDAVLREIANRICRALWRRRISRGVKQLRCVFVAVASRANSFGDCEPCGANAMGPNSSYYELRSTRDKGLRSPVGRGNYSRSRRGTL